MRKRLALATLAVAGGVAGVVGLAGSASASSTEPITPKPAIVTKYAASFTGPSTTASVVHEMLEPDTVVDAYCFRIGQPLDGNAVWFAINHDGETGYIHRAALSAPTDLPHC
jgi:hypothetical protein